MKTNSNAKATVYITIEDVKPEHQEAFLAQHGTQEEWTVEANCHVVPYRAATLEQPEEGGELEDVVAFVSKCEVTDLLTEGCVDTIKDELRSYDPPCQDY